MGFEWQTETEEEALWEKRDEARTAPRRWPWFLLLPLLLLASAGFLLWQAQERVGEAEASVREAVLSSHALGRRAVAEQDEELFFAVLSGREPDWSYVQRQLFESGRVFEGAGLALGMTPLPGEPVVVAIEIGPELREATLVAAHDYAVAAAGGVTETITLEQRYLYRRGARRWLLSPRENEFWGDQKLIEEGRIRLASPARDSVFADRLAAVLDRRLDALCARVTVRCRPSGVLRIELSSSPDSLLPLPPDDRYRSGRPLVLPAPSLVGTLPSRGGASGDVAAYEALLAAYVEPALTQALVEMTGYDCCVGLIFFEALVERLSLEPSGAELRSTPLVEKAVSFAGEPISLPGFSRLWTRTALKTEGGRAVPAHLERAQAALFVDFLEEEYGLDQMVLLQRLVGAGNFFAWLAALGIYDAGATTTPGAVVETAWYHFLFEQANRLQAGSAPAPPEQVVQLLCRNEADWGLYTYDPLSSKWTRRTEVPGPAPAMLSLPDDGGVVIFELLPGRRADHLQPRLLYGAQWSRLDSTLQPLYLPSPDPQAATLTIWNAEEAGSSRGSPGLLEPAACAAQGECDTTPLPAIPFWSPDGERALLWAPGQRQVQFAPREALLGPGQAPALSVAGYGTWPFWYDEETIGLIQNGEAVVMRRLEDEAFRSLVNIEMLAQAADRRLPVAPAAAIHWVQPVPRSSAAPVDAAETLLFVVAVSWPAQTWPEHELLLVRAGGDGALLDITPLLIVPAWSVQMPHAILSPSGRWLALNVAPDVGADVRFVIYDLVAGIVRADEELPAFPTFHSYDWTADGRWLARSGGDRLELIAPRADGELYRRFVTVDGLHCGSVAWTDK